MLPRRGTFPYHERGLRMFSWALQKLGRFRTTTESAPDPRISCETCWVPRAQCAFPLMKGAHVVVSRAAYRKFGYLARFWPDVGINGCWHDSAGSARKSSLRKPSTIGSPIDDRSLRFQKVRKRNRLPHGLTDGSQQLMIIGWLLEVCGGAPRKRPPPVVCRIPGTEHDDRNG